MAVLVLVETLAPVSSRPETELRKTARATSQEGVAAPESTATPESVAPPESAAMPESAATPERFLPGPGRPRVADTERLRERIRAGTLSDREAEYYRSVE